MSIVPLCFFFLQIIVFFVLESDILLEDLFLSLQIGDFLLCSDQFGLVVIDDLQKMFDLVRAEIFVAGKASARALLIGWSFHCVPF